jgi:hypothetical protein
MLSKQKEIKKYSMFSDQCSMKERVHENCELKIEY